MSAEDEAAIPAPAPVRIYQIRLPGCTWLEVSRDVYENPALLGKQYATIKRRVLQVVRGDVESDATAQATAETA